MEALAAYLPADRQQALARGTGLPDRTQGAALSVDISGFTRLTETLAQALGPRRGAEELTHRLNAVYDVLIAEVHRYGGSVVGFSGDAFTSWFDHDTGPRALAAALAMQRAMPAVARVPLEGGAATLAVRAAVATGPVRRFALGDPGIQRIDAIAGGTLDLLAAADHLAQPGEVVLAERAGALGEGVRVSGWRADPLSGLRVALVEGLEEPPPPSPWPALEPGALDEAELRPWVLRGVYERLRSGQGRFMADLRPVTALFLAFDGIGYDEDDDAGILLDAYVRRVQAVVARYGGSLIQLTFGDKGSYLYAAFGAPVAHDDDAVKAVTVALELLEPPPNLSFVHSARAGVAEGQMYTGAYGSALRRTYGVLGDKTNLAARLMQLARPGQVLCDEEVYRQAARRWAFEALPSVRVKGKAGKVRVYAPTGQAAGAPAAPSAERALVGREEAVARLRGALEALKGGRGGVLFVEGEAGIGKSRLVQELVRHLRELGMSGLLGAGHSIEQQTPYRAWRDVFASYFGLEGLTDVLERQEQVRRVVQEVAPKLAPRLPLLNDLLNLGLPDTPLTAALDPALRQESLVALLVQLLRAWAQERPLTLVLEDAYWLDSLSWDLVVKVARALLGALEPLLLVVVTRPIGEQALGFQAAQALRGLPGSGTLEVGALGVEEVAALVAGRLGLPAEALPPRLARLVRERSGGNPFFAEELTHALREQGLVRVETAPSPRLEVSPGLFEARSVLPDTLQGVVLSRIDRLLPDRQLTLKVASVIGRNYPYLPLRDGVMRLAALGEALLHQHLHELIRRGLILLEAPDPEPLYAFKHAITYEVTYQSLLFAQRRQIHRVLAEWYEQAHAERLEAAYPLLAHHWLHAAEGGDDALARKARDYLARAGHQALRLCAYPEALSFLQRALALTPASPGDPDALERAGLLTAAGVAHEKMADYVPATRLLLEALELAHAASDPRAQSRALAELSWVAVRRGEYARAERLGEEALEYARQAGDRPACAKAGSRLGVIAAYQGHYPAAARRFEESLGLYRALGEAEGVASCLNSLGLVEVFRGELEPALRRFEEALAVARGVSNPEILGKIQANLGLVAEKRGDYAEAARHYGESLEVFREISARHAALINVLNLGDVAAAQGDGARAGGYYREALAEALGLGALPIALGTLRGMAAVWARGGEPLRAAELLGLALSHPASDAEMRQQAEPVLEGLRALLPPQALEAALARGRAMTLEGVLRQWGDPVPGEAAPQAPAEG